MAWVTRYSPPNSSPSPSRRSTVPARIRGSPTVLPEPVSRSFSLGMSVPTMYRGAVVSVTGWSSRYTDCTRASMLPGGVVGIGRPTRAMLSVSWARSQSQPTVTVKVCFTIGTQTFALTAATWPTVVSRGVNSISERP